MNRQLVLSAGAVMLTALLTHSIAGRQTRQYIPAQLLSLPMREIPTIEPDTKPFKQTALIARIRRLEVYEAWKQAVFIRDRFTCQQCGRRNGRERVIEADHVEPLSKLVKQYGLLTTQQAVECPVLWEVKNGRTLCKGCHQNTDSYPKQFVKSK